MFATSSCGVLFKIYGVLISATARIWENDCLPAKKNGKRARCPFSFVKNRKFQPRSVYSLKYGYERVSVPANLFGFPAGAFSLKFEKDTPRTLVPPVLRYGTVNKFF
jgi:hypothetical protein